MDVNIRQWDEFWKSKCAAPMYGKPDTYERLLWQVGLEFLDGVYMLASGKKVLECGCGRGSDSLHLKQRGYETTLSDNSYEALKLARSNFDCYGLKGDFVLCDARRLAFQDNTFDIVISSGLLEHFGDIHSPIREMLRVLKPGGLFVADIITNKFSVQVLADIEGFYARFMKRLFRLKFKGILKDSLMRSPIYVNSFSKESYRRTMLEEGLRDVRITGTRPFPYLVLPRSLEKVYVSCLAKMLWLWRRFDNSKSTLTDIWAPGWYAWGFKKEGK